MSLPSDGVNANALAETTTIPTGKKLIFLDPDTNEGGIITLENLTKQILSNLTSQTFNLDQGTKTLPAALNELNSKAGKLVFINATPGITGASIDTVARDIIDNQLPNDEECFYFISFTSGSRYRMIVQKYINNDYAAYILFGYAKTEISYHVKLNGVWK